MTNLKKLGLTALAGSLVASTAVAGALDVSGTAKVKYQSLGSERTSGNPWSDATTITFSGSGDLDNGMTINYGYTMANAVFSSSKLALDMGDTGVVSFGKIIKEAYKAAEDLEKEGISCEVIDLRTVRPLDINSILESVKKTNRLVILEEAWPFGNVSTEITYQVQQKAFDYLDAPIIKINTADTPAPYSPVLLEEWLPNSNDVVKAVKKVLYK